MAAETGPGNGDSSVGLEGEKSDLRALEARLAEYREEIERLRQVEADRAHLLGELRHAEKLEAVGRLAGGVAHRLNNLLHPIMTFTTAAKDRVVDEALHKYLDMALTSTRQARDLVRELQGFARQQNADLELLDSRSTIGEAVGEASRVVPDRIRLRLHDDASGSIRVGRDGLRQLLQNLIANAVEAIEGRGEIRVTARDRDLDDSESAPLGLGPGRFLELEVLDDGIGIAETDLEQIFEPFFTTKGESERSGLGLALAWSLARRWDGTVRVASGPGEGATFSVWIPKAEQAI